MRQSSRRGNQNAQYSGLVALSTLLLLSACGGGGGAATGSQAGAPAPGPTSTPTPAPDPGQTATPTPTPTPGSTVTAAAMVASNWEIGPVIKGADYSSGMPLTPTQNTPPEQGWWFDFPLFPGSVHYVTFHYGSLAGKTHIVMHYKVEADPGVVIHPITQSDAPSMGPTIYFQEKGDDWDTDGMRWWATFATPLPINPGEYTMDVPLDGKWTSVVSMTAATNPSQFAKAKQNADRVGFTFGGGTGYGHGVYADGNARFVLESFSIE